MVYYVAGLSACADIQSENVTLLIIENAVIFRVSGKWLCCFVSLFF